MAEGHRSEALEYPGTHRRDILQTPSSITCQLRQDEKHWPGTPEGLSGALGRSIILMSKVRSPGLLVKSMQRTPTDLAFSYWHQELTNTHTRQPTPHHTTVIFTVTCDQAAKVSLLSADSMLCTTPQQSATGSPLHLPVSPRVSTRQLYRLPVHQKPTSNLQYGNLANCLGC